MVKMVEENTKYIAEAWIDDGKEEDFKKSFLQNFIDQLQHHKVDGEGVGFDADTVDGMHYCQIVDVFDDKIKDFISSFSVGKVVFNQNQRDYFIGFDGVKLYIEGLDGYEDYQTLSWIEDNPITPAPDLKGVFESLYQELIDVKNELDLKIEETASSLSEFQEKSQDLLDKVDANGDLKADSINGLRFYVIRESDYENLTNEEKNNPRHVYIIKDNDFVIPEDLLDEHENTAPISNLYQFRVNTETSYLQYRHENEVEGVWHNIAPLGDFYDEEALLQLIIDILGGDQNYPLRPESVKAALEQIQFESINNWPNIQDTYVVGGYYGNKNNNPTIMEADYTNQAGYKYINLNDLKTSIDEEINSKASEVMDFVNQNASDIVALSQNITNLRDGSDLSIDDLNNNITALNNNITRLTNQVSNIKDNWVHKSFWNGDGQLYYNEDLKLAYFRISMFLKYNSANKNTWLQVKGKTLPKIPRFDIRVVSTPWTVVKFDNNGGIYYYTNYENSINSLSVTGAALYPYL